MTYNYQTFEEHLGDEYDVHIACREGIAPAFVWFKGKKRCLPSDVPHEVYKRAVARLETRGVRLVNGLCA